MNQQLPRFISFFFAFLLHFLSLVLVSTSDYTVPTKYFINCGSDSPVSLDGRSFVGDKNSDSSIIVGDSRDIRTENSSLTQELYQTARIYNKPSSYVVKIDESGTYIVRFHFFPFISHGIDLSEGIFSVSARHFLFLSNFSVRNSSSLPVIREYFLDITPGKFQVDFVPENTSFAFVNAIEVFLLSPNITVDSALAVPPVAAANKDGLFYGVKSNALQTVYRVNVGGGNVSDSGAFWRKWVGDDNYIVSKGSAENRSTNIKLGQESGATEYIAPLSVYGTCKLVKSTGSSMTNLTWKFQVKRNARHLVRLHFCDIISPSISVDLAFNVFIYSEFNWTVRPSEIVSKTASPFFCDLVVDSDNSGYVDISMTPMEDSKEKEAFLNGLEIMEFVSNTSFELPPYKQKKHPPFVVIGSVSGAVLVIILIVLFVIGLKCRKSKHRKAFPAKSETSHSWITEKPGNASPIPNFNLKLKMPLAEILAATQNFNTKLLIGEGGFGKVFTGTLQGGKKVAVKRSDSSYGQGIYEFQTEVLVLSKIRHRHLVSLIGYCNDGNEMILVYEFMEKGTLRDHLYDWKENSKTKSHSQPSELTWKQRLEICIGSAKDLHSLPSHSFRWKSYSP